MWYSAIGNTIAESQARIKLLKKVMLRTTDDTVMIRVYLEKLSKESDFNLQQSYSDRNYLLLRDSIIAFLLVSNCKRAGEVERMTFDDFESLIIKNDDCRLEIRRKRTKPVPLVFKKNLWDRLQRLIKNRVNAKISEKNPYIFAMIHDNKSSDFKYISACQVLRKFSEECEAEMPETLRGTLFRKQVATHGGEVGLNDAQGNHLSLYLGHTDKIHLQNYRLSVFERDVVTSHLIQKAQGVQLVDSVQAEEPRIDLLESTSQEGRLNVHNISNDDCETQDHLKNEQETSKCEYHIFLLINLK